MKFFKLISPVLLSFLLMPFACSPELEELPSEGLNSKIRITNFTLNSKTASSAILSFNITETYNTAINDYGICYTTDNSTPTLNDLSESLGSTKTAKNNATVTLKNLSTGTYKARAYFIVGDHANYSSNTVTFAIDGNGGGIEIYDPVVEQVTNSTAKIAYGIVGVGSQTIDDYGLAYCSACSTVFISNADKVTHSGKLTSDLAEITEELTGLSANTTYSLKAYFTIGEEVTYSAPKIFNTSTNNISISKPEITNITNNSALARFGISGLVNAAKENPNLQAAIEQGTVLDDHGVCYSTTNNLPTENDITVNLGSLYYDNSALEAEMLGLTSSTTYYVRSFYLLDGTYHYSPSVTKFSTESGTTLVYGDNFENSTDWEIGSYTLSDDKTASAELLGGYYHVYAASPDYFSIWYNNNGFNNYDHANDFAVSTSIQLGSIAVDSISSQGGLCIGTLDEYIICFLITSNGSYYIGIKDGDWKAWDGFTSNSSINTKGGANTLEIVRTGSSLSFYLNDALVHTQYNVTSLPADFSLFGFNGNFYFDYFSLYQ